MLRYFQVVAECGSYTRGSHLLHVSQPAISRSIKLLEEELGQQLFVRHGHGVVLTEAGRTLLARSQTILQQVEQMREEIQRGGSGPSGAVTLAIPPAAGSYLVPALLRRIAERAPNITLKVVGGFSGHINEWLAKQDVDLALVHDAVPQRGFTQLKLLEEDVFAVGRAGGFETAGPSISVEQLRSLPLVLPSRPNASRRLLDNWAAPAGLWLEPRIEVDDHTIIRALVKQGVGFGLLTRGAFADDLAAGLVEARPLSPPTRWPLALIDCQRSADFEASRVVTELIVETVESLLEARLWPGARRIGA